MKVSIVGSGWVGTAIGKGLAKMGLCDFPRHRGQRTSKLDERRLDIGTPEFYAEALYLSGKWAGVL